MASTSGVTRISQRSVKSCRECAMRKVRCDKKIPCQRCIDRGRRELCTRETVRISKSTTIHFSELKFLDSLLRVMNSGYAKSMVEKRIRSLTTGINDAQVDGIEADTDPTDTEDVAELENAPVTLESLAWGKPVRLEPEQMEITPWLAEPNDRGPVGDLPAIEKAYQLIEFHFEYLEWFHHCLHVPTFRRECELFWTDDEYIMSQGSWLALYLAVLSTSLYHMPLAQKTLLFSDHELRVLPKLWFESSMQALIDADFMNSHSVYTLQTFGILGLCAHTFGYSKGHSVLTATVVRIAQSLGLHRKSSYATLNNSKDVRLDMEVNRRAWWRIMVEDWYTTSVTDSYISNPLHAAVDHPLHCHDEDMLEIWEEIPALTGWIRYSAKVASLMPELIDGLKTYRGSERYEHLLRIDGKFRLIISQLPRYLDEHQPFKPEWPHWVKWVRRILPISAADKVIMIHKTYFIKSLTSETYKYTRLTCIAAAKTILKTQQACAEEDVSAMWVVSAFSIGAAMVIILALLYHSNDDEREGFQVLVHNCIRLLATREDDRVAQRGVVFLRRALDVVDQGEADGNVSALLKRLVFKETLEPVTASPQGDLMGLDSWLDELLEFQI